MDTVLYFIRHGQVENPRNIVYARLPRFKLSQTGREQAITAGALLKNINLTVIFTSPMLRARQTAGLVAREHLGIPIKISSLINENHTPFQGSSLKVIEERNGDIFTGVYPPFEQPADLLARSVKFITRVCRQYQGKSIAVVTHGDIIRVIIRWAMGYPPERDSNETPFPGTGSITTLSYNNLNKQKPILKYLP